MSGRTLKSGGDSRTHLAEIVGEESLQGRRMQAGAILALMDVAAGRAAFRHAGSPVVTLSFDRVDLIYPIRHQDLIRLEAEVALVGNSSMLVGVQGFRREPHANEFTPIQSCTVTMVAIGPEGRPNPDIPGLRQDTPEEKTLGEAARQIKARTAEWLGMQKAAGGSERLSLAEVEEPLNRDKPQARAPRETEIEVRRMFLPRHNNVLGTIFGGDILLWMDRVATYTARAFTGNPHMVTIAMNRIFFKQPIYSTDLVDLVARVVYVRNYTLEVEIEVHLQRLSGEMLDSHTGYFTVLNHDEDDAKQPITFGLKLSEDDQASLRRYQQARMRHHFWEAHRPPSSDISQTASGEATRNT